MKYAEEFAEASNPMLHSDNGFCKQPSCFKGVLAFAGFDSFLSQATFAKSLMHIKFEQYLHTKPSLLLIETRRRNRASTNSKP